MGTGNGVLGQGRTKEEPGKNRGTALHCTVLFCIILRGPCRLDGPFLPNMLKLVRNVSY